MPDRFSTFGRRTQGDGEGARREERLGQVLRKLGSMEMPGITEPCDGFVLRHLASPVSHNEGRDNESRDEQQPKDSTEMERRLIAMRDQVGSMLKVWNPQINRNYYNYN
jgi:hypothetical protein